MNALEKSTCKGTPAPAPARPGAPLGAVLGTLLFPLALAASSSAVQAKGPEPKTESRVRFAEIGKPAPGFELKSLDGKVVKLSDFKKRTVVLEWLNPACPYCKYAYGEKGPLHTYPEELRGKGITWLTIVSEKPRNPGGNPETIRKFVEDHGIRVPVLLDPEGKVCRLYGARSTPQVFVINERGALVYRGAVDNAPLGQVAGNEARVHYVAAAIADLASGHSVLKSETKPYGCPIQSANP